MYWSEVFMKTLREALTTVTHFISTLAEKLGWPLLITFTLI